MPPVLGAALGLSRSPSVTPPARKATMLGVASPPGSDAKPPPRKRDPQKQTMLGVAPANAGLELANLDEDVHSSKRSDELSLESASEIEADLPAPASSSGAPSSRTRDEGIIDLPSISPSGPPSSGRGPDSGEFDLEAASLPQPHIQTEDFDLPDLGASADLPDLTPRPAGAPIQTRPNRPPPPRRPASMEADLPDLHADLPDLDAGLPDLGGDSAEIGLPGLELTGFPESGGRGLPEPAGQLPDLSAPRPRPTAPSGRAQSVPAKGPFSEPDEYPSSIEPGPSDPFAEPAGVSGATRSGDPATFGEVDFGGSDETEDEDEFDAFPTEDAPRTTTSAGGEGYGDVTLEGGDGALDLGDEIDRGQVPDGVARGPAAAASATVDISRPARPEKYSKKEKKRRTQTSSMSKGTKIAVFSVLGLVVAGGALASLLPDVGPYGAYYVIDQLHAEQYEGDLARDIATAQKHMALDTANEISLAFAEVAQGLEKAPRYKPRAAYAAYIGFFHQLRFGAASDESARAHALLDSLKDVDAQTPYLALLQLTEKAASGHPEVAVDQAGHLLGRGIEYAVLVGESALVRGRGDVALSAWTQVLEREKTARSHFGMARTQYLLGDVGAVEQQLTATLAANPKHVGGRILRAKLKLKERTNDEEIEEKMTPLSRGGDGASRGEQVDALIVLGQLHLLRARLKKAEAAFTEALQKNAGSAAAQRGLAEVLFESGRFSEALARYESALSVEPGDLETSLGVVKSKLRLEQLDDAVKLLDSLSGKYPNSTALSYYHATAKEAVGDKEGAQKAFEKAIALGENVPELVLSHVALTRLLSQQGKVEEANAIISQAEKKFPNDPAVFEALGELSASRGSFDDAVMQFDKAIALDPKNIGLHFARGIALRQARRFDEAKAAFDRVEEESADYPGLALERGNLFEASGNTKQALLQYEEALAAAPNDLDLKLRVACGKANAGQSQEVIEQLRPVLEARPNSAEVNFCQGLALLNDGDLPSAKIYLERAVARDPSRAKHHLYVGWVNLEMGDLVAATRALDETIKLDSTLADAYWKRGELRVKQRAVQDALVDLDMALELAPSRTEAHAQKALAYLELGKEQEAMAEFDKAVNAPVVDPAWRYRYGDLLLANRRPAEARKQLELALEQLEARDQKPVWMANAHRLLALSIGRKKEALPHFQAYIEAKKGTNDPYLGEAAREMDAILSSLGH